MPKPWQSDLTPYHRIAVAIALVVLTGLTLWRGRRSIADEAQPCRHPIGVRVGDRPPWVLCWPRARAPLPDVLSRAGEVLSRAGEVLPRAGEQGCASACAQKAARWLTAGQQVWIEPGRKISVRPLPGAARLALGVRVDINVAAVEDLLPLPRIGAAIARRIVAARSKLGCFASLQQLKLVRGIGSKTIDNIRDIAMAGPCTR